MKSTTDWNEFFAAQAGRGVRPVLTHLLELRADESPGVAVDLGCGEGTETRFLLDRGWRVHAVDAEPGTEARVMVGVSPDQAHRLTVQQASFERLRELPRADLVYSGFALPFCAPDAFPALWALVRASIDAGGWFAGEFFGPHDDWASRPDMNFHNRGEVEQLFDGLDIVDLVEDDRDGWWHKGPKHWHAFHVIARSSPVDSQNSGRCVT